jgi:hypothetical protein
MCIHVYSIPTAVVSEVRVKLRHRSQLQAIKVATPELDFEPISGRGPDKQFPILQQLVGFAEQVRSPIQVSRMLAAIVPVASFKSRPAGIRGRPNKSAALVVHVHAITPATKQSPLIHRFSGMALYPMTVQELQVVILGRQIASRCVPLNALIKHSSRSLI